MLVDDPQVHGPQWVFTSAMAGNGMLRSRAGKTVRHTNYVGMNAAPR